MTSDVPITDNSVLVLTYPTVDGDLLIDGVTEGNFPSAFRFSTTKPPPVTEEIDFTGNGKLVKTAQLGLAAVPASHPAIVSPVSLDPGIHYADPTPVHVTRTYYDDTSLFTQDLTSLPCRRIRIPGTRRPTWTRRQEKRSPLSRIRSFTSACEKRALKSWLIR